MVTHYAKPDYIVEVDHDGVTYDISTSVVQWDLYREENAVDILSLLIADEDCDFFMNKVHGWWDDAGTIKNDTIKLYCNYEEVSSPLTTTDLRFYGFVEKPKIVSSGSGKFLHLQCRSYFRALLDLKVGQEYGSESSNSGLDTLQEILQDGTDGIVDLWVNKLLGSGVNSGYTVNDTYVEDLADVVPYLFFPYTPVRDAVNDLCDLVQALRAANPNEDTGTGPHWIGRTIESPADTFTHYLLVGEVNDHEHAGAPAVETYWPTWWNTNEAGSTLAEGIDFMQFDFERVEPEANYILYFGNFRKPGNGDFWTGETAGASALWASGAGTASSARTSVGAGGVGGGDPMVGSTCLKIEPTNVLGVGTAFYPAARDLNLHFIDISTTSSIPHLSFYHYSTDIDLGTHWVYCATESTAFGDGNNDYFIGNLVDAMTPVTDEWIRFDLPIGPYWALDPGLQETGGASEFDWVVFGNADWNEINTIAFTSGSALTYDTFVDGVHFNGQVTRGAYLSGVPYFKVKSIHDDVAKDDSIDNATDTGTIASLAYAELLRAARRPIQGVVAVPGLPTILAGQKAHVHGAATNGGFRINKDMRIPQHHLHCSGSGLVSYLTLTDDLLNARPMSPLDAYNLVQRAAEPSAQNRTMLSIKSWPIDITQTKLETAYTFNDFF